MTTIKQYLLKRGVPDDATEELLALLPQTMPQASCAFFYTAQQIMNSDTWFHCPKQTRFVLVGQCPNGDGIGIDTTVNPGAIYFISHEHVGDGECDDDMTVKIAPSPIEYVRRIHASDDNCPMDYWEAKQR